jgi:DNA-binding NarL/FixJ family response regulator
MRVLIVDDSTLVGEHLRALLAEVDGLEIMGQALDVGEAEEAITRLQPEVVILDLQLATGSGITVLQYLRRSNPKTLVVVLTNHANAYYRKKCLAEGANYFLDKSAEFESLLKILCQAVTA